METNKVELNDEMKYKYLQMRELLDIKEKHEPDPEPYKSKYKARDILQEMVTALINRQDESGKMCLRDNAMLAAVYSILGTVAMDVDEPSVGEEHLLRTISMVEHDSCSMYYVLTMLGALNQLALLYSMRQNNAKALEQLEKASKIYQEFKEIGSSGGPVSYNLLFTGKEDSENDNGVTILEKTYTLTLYYLAQVHKALGDNEKAAMFCHSTLKRQLETNDYDKIDWAINAASLSQFFTEKYCFKEARHHLSAANVILKVRQKELEVFQEDSEEHEKNKTEYAHRKSDVARCWVKYCLMLLSCSKERLLNADDANVYTHNPESVLNGLLFPSLDVKEEENRVACNYLLTIDDVRPVFSFAQFYCNKAMDYYTMEEHASDHVTIVQDLSLLYSYLTFFEEDEDKQCKIHKKRKDLLTKTVSSLNETYYLDVCRELWMEIGVVCSAMVEIKSVKMQEKPTSHGINKLNSIAQEAVACLSKFIKSYNDKRTDKAPESYPKEEEKDILMAHLYTAQMYSKFVNADRYKLLESTANSLQYYKILVDYCARNESTKEIFAAELSICKEMVRLLPLKLDKIHSMLE